MEATPGIEPGCTDLQSDADASKKAVGHQSPKCFRTRGSLAALMICRVVRNPDNHRILAGLSRFRLRRVLR